METYLFNPTIKIPDDFWTPVLLPEMFWVPPPSGRFFELDASDESWARPLGIGREMNWQQFSDYLSKKLMDEMTARLGIPSRLFDTDLPYTNYYGAR